MKKILYKIVVLSTLMLLPFSSAYAVYTLALFPTANSSDVTYYSFENAGTNVSDEMIVYASVPSSEWADYSFWVGENNARTSSSVTAGLSSLGTSASGVFSVNIYSSQSDKDNYFPHSFTAMDDTNYIYGMACWIQPITSDCVAGQPSSAGSHVFMGTGNEYAFTFSVATVNASFKILKSSDGASWSWDAGQVGHPSSGTVLNAGSGIGGGGAGDCYLDLPGIKSGDKVTLNLQKNGAVYTLSASFIPTPELTQVGDGCNTLIFRLGAYDATKYTPVFTLNGTSVSFTSNLYEVVNPVRGRQYVMSGCFSDLSGAKGTSVTEVSVLPDLVEMPLVSVSADNCGTAPVFTLENPVAGVSYTWKLNGSVVTPSGSTYTVPAPEAGVTYTMEVTADNGCTSQTSQPVSRVYRSAPAVPQLEVAAACGTPVVFTVKNYDSSNTYTWKVNDVPVTAAESYTVVNPVDLGQYTASVTASSNGCESQAGEATATYRRIPDVPLVKDYVDCPQSGTESWESLVTASGTLKWYTSDTSEGAMPSVPDFNKNATQNTSYWVSQTSAGGCESGRVKVSVIVYEKPNVPDVTNYVECQTSGTGAWADLVTATGELRWYESETSTVRMASVPDFNKNVVGVLSYWVVQLSADGCESERVQVIVDVRSKPTVYAGDDRYICAGKTTLLGSAPSPDPQIRYMWEPSNLLEDPNVAQPVTRPLNSTVTFKVTAYNESMSACYATSSVVVNVTSKPVLSYESTSVSICPNTTATFNALSVEGDVSYSWTPSEKVVNPISASTSTVPLDTNQEFTVSATRKLSPLPSEMSVCSSSINLNAVVVAIPDADAGDDQAVCIGTEAKVGMANVFGVDYQWSPADKVANPTSASTYTTPITEDILLTLTATLHADPHCSNTDQVKITKVNKPNVYTVSGDNYYCTGQPTTSMIVKLSSSDRNVEYALYKDGVLKEDYIPGTGAALQWYDNEDGLYTVKARVIGTDCEEDMAGSANIIERHLPDAKIENLGYVACPGETTQIQITLIGDAPFKFTLSENDVDRVVTVDNNVYTYDLTPYTATTITIKKLEDNYCTNYYSQGANPTLDLDIPSLDDFKIHSSQTSPAVCPGDNIVLSIDYDGDKAHYQWSTGERDKKSIVVSPAATSEYSIYAWTETGCEINDKITITVADAGSLKIEGLRDPAYYCNNETTTITGYPTGGSFSTNPSSVLVGTNQLDFSSITQNSTVDITYTYGLQGCVFDTTVTVFVSAIITKVDWMIVPDFGPPYRPSYSYCLPDIEHPTQAYKLQGYPQQRNGRWDVLADAGAHQASIVVTNPDLSQADFKNFSAGSYWITYYIKDEFGCEASKTKQVEIRLDNQELVDMKGFSYDPSDVVCNKSTSAKIIADNITGTYNFNGVPFTQQNGVATYNPYGLSQGAHSAIYTILDDKGCPHNYTAPYAVRAPVNIDPFGLADSYCDYDDDVVINITSLTETDGVVNIYRCKSGTDCSAEEDWELVEAVVPKSNPPYFRPTWGEGYYKIVYDYNDGTCDWSYTEYTNVYAPTPIDMNLKSDYCKGDVIKLAATPLGGFYTTNAPEGALINNTFYTQTAGLGVFEMTYETKNSHSCISRDTTQIQVRGTDNLAIFGLEEKYCSPEGGVEIFGFPIDYGDATFTGPSFLTNDPSRKGYASIDLTQGDFSTSYDVTYHYTIHYNISTGQQESCETTLTKSFRILNEASDFGGFEHLEYICADRDEVNIVANHTQNTTFTFSEPGSPAFVDNGDGTAVIYPKLLGEGLYMVTMNHKLIEEGVEVCSSTKEKSFYIERIADIPQISLYCKDGNNAVKMERTEPDVKYTLTVNNNFFQEITGDGNPIYFDGVPLDYALLKVAANHNGCMFAMSKVIEVEKLKLDYTSTNVTCADKNDGSFIATVTGGRLPYDHTLSFKNSGTVIVKDSLDFNLAKEDYTFSVTDSVGCTRTVDFTITEPTELKVSIQKQDVDCTGKRTGVLRAIPSGGTGTPSYEWKNLTSGQIVGTDATLVGVPSGNYQVTIKDANGCEASATETLLAPEQLQVHVTSTTDVEIIGEATGAIEIEVTGGTSNYSYHWTGRSVTPATEDSQNQTNLLAGNYFVTVTDARGCTASTSAMIKEPTPYIIGEEIKNVNCKDGNDGHIYMSVSGAAGPYIYTWTYPDATTSSSKDITSLKAGYYHFKVEDSLGNIYENDYQVTEPEALTVETTITSNFEEPCYGDEVANIDIAIEGGTLPYSVTWIGVTDEQKTDSAHVKNLAAATYQVKIVDALGCPTSLTQTITQPDAPLSFKSAVTTENTCHGEGAGSITIEMQGGTEPYSYQWSGAGVRTTDQNQTGLNGGDFEVVVTDANGCSISRKFTLFDPEVLNVSANGDDLKCFNDASGKIWAEVEGGVFPYIFEWKNDASTVISNDSVMTAMDAGEYHVEVKDNLGCKANAFVKIEQPEELKATTSVWNVDCYGNNNGKVSVDVNYGTPAYKYEWFKLPDVTTVISIEEEMTNLEPAQYMANVKDANGCSVSTLALTVTQPNKLTISYTKEDVAIYGEATGKINAEAHEGSQPYTFTWSGPSITAANEHNEVLTDLLAGNYYLVVEDANGCKEYEMVSITQPEVLDVKATVTDASCYGLSTGGIVLNVSGGDGDYSYSWTSVKGYTASTKDILNVPADDYTVVVSDHSGASFTRTYKVEEPNELIAEVVTSGSILSVKCYGDKNGAIKCAYSGGTAPYTVTWNGNDIPAVLADSSYVTGLGAGTYTISLKDANNCQAAVISQRIDGPSEPLKVDGVVENNKCFMQKQGKITLTVAGGTPQYTYSWTGGEGVQPDVKDQTTLVSGETYRVEVTDANFCKESKVFTLDALTEMQMNLESTPVSCNGKLDGTLKAEVRGGAGSYVPEWKNSTGTWRFTGYESENLPADTYTFTVSDANGCTLTDNVEITEPTKLTVKIDATDVLCNGLDDGEAYANVPEGAGTMPYEYIWYKDDVEYGRGSHLTNLGSGYYRVDVTDRNGCSATDNTVIKSSVPINIIVTHKEDVAIHGQATGYIELQVTGGTPPLDYTWSGVGIDPTKEKDLNQYNLIAGKYYLTVRDQYDCSKDIMVEITQPESMVVTPKIKYIDCYGDKGYIELTISGGYAPYNCNWTSLKGYTSNEQKIYNLDADTYTVVVEDQQGNRYSNSYIIADKEQVEWLLLPSSRTTLDCFGDADGYINLQIGGGTPPYSIEWQGPNLHVTGVNNVSHLIAGQYTAYIKDSKNCLPAETFNIEVTQPKLLELEAEVTDNACNGLHEGAIELTIKGGTPDYKFRWSGFDVKPEDKDQSNLTAGEYHLRMEDRNSCTVDTIFTIKEREALHALLSGGNSICEGDKMELFINLEGTSPWDVTYTDGRDIMQAVATERTTSIEISPEENVEYSLVKVTDAAGCELETSGSVPVEVYAKPGVSILSAGTDCCLGDAVIVDMMFFNEGPWSVTYTDGSHTYTDGPFSSAHTELAITPTATGTTHYTILTVSNEHCTVSVDHEFDVTTYVYPNLTIDVPPYICQPNPVELVLHPTGDSPWVVTYTINGQHLEEDVTEDGQKIVHTPTREDNIFIFESIRSGENCITKLGKQFQTKVGMLPLDATLISGPNVVCRDSEVKYHTQVISYADKYEWELPAGFSIASGLGSSDVTIAVGSDAVSGEIKVHGKNDCGEGGSSSIYVEVTKPIEAGGEITSPLYVCKNTAMFQLSVSEITGATHYEWTVPTGYTITSGQGTRSVLITIDEYALSSTVSVVPSNACMEAPAISKFVTIRPLPIAEAGVDFNTACKTDTRLNAKNVSGTTAEWSLISGNANIKTPTSATTEITDLLFGKNEFRWNVNDGYCLNFDTVAVTNDNPGITQPEATDIITCEDNVRLRAGEPEFGAGRWTLIAGDGHVETPDGNETMVTDLSTKNTNVIRWEVYYGACSNTIDVNVVSHSLQKLADAGEDGTTTDGTYRLSARIVSDKNVKGEWSVVGGAGTVDDPTSENTTVRGLSEGINTLRWTLKGYNCEAYDEVQIRGVDEPIASYKVEKDAGCVPFTVYFNNTTVGDATYKWEFGDGFTSEQRSPEHTFEKAGTFTVKLTAKGDRKTDTYEGTITVYPQPEASFTSGPTQLYIPNALAQFYNTSHNTVAWFWDFGDKYVKAPNGTSTEENPTYKYQESDVYTIKLVVTDEKGCKDTIVAENYINVSRESFIVFPTAFVPNLEQANGGAYSPEERRLDIFYPVWRNVDTYSLSIYNQWGTQVFQSNDVLIGWDGYFQGKCAVQGTYVYKAEGRYKDGTPFKVSGNLMLVR